MSSRRKDSSIQIGRRVQYLRELTGQSQSGMAKELGIPTRTYQKWEIGEYDFTASSILMLAEHFSVQPSELFADPPSDWLSQAERRTKWQS